MCSYDFLVDTYEITYIELTLITVLVKHGGFSPAEIIFKVEAGATVT